MAVVSLRRAEEITREAERVWEHWRERCIAEKARADVAEVKKNKAYKARDAAEAAVAAQKSVAAVARKQKDAEHEEWKYWRAAYIRQGDQLAAADAVCRALEKWRQYPDIDADNLHHAAIAVRDYIRRYPDPVEEEHD